MSETDSAPESRPGAASARRSGWERAVLAGLGVAGALVVGLALILGIGLASTWPKLPDISGLSDYRPKLPMKVWSADGVLIGEFGEERRSFTPINEIPAVMKDAVLAIEDARFYEHGGVDYVGVLRAALANLNESKSQGASTITMQVARNFYLSSEKRFTRKIYEALLALKIERQLTKDQILQVYMNQIYLGQRAYGFTAAAETYFGKSIKDVTLAEAAMLAGLPKAPSAYNPIANPARATERQHYILDRMVENHFITPTQRDTAKAEELHYRTRAELPADAEYVAETARMLMFSRYGPEAYTRGLDVHTTVRTAEQQVAYRALRRGLLTFDRRHGYRGPEAHVDLKPDADATDPLIAEALQDNPDDDEYRSAVVLEAGPRRVTAVLASGDTVAVTDSGLALAAAMLGPKAPPKLRITRGAVIRVIDDGKGRWAITQVPEVEGALVSMDPRTGFIRAMVGGFDFSQNKFNHVTQAWRQPGSSFKPFVYSAALEKGITPATVVNDAPLFFDADVTGSQPWEPKNYDDTFDGPLSLRRGLAKSKNIVSIRVLQKITPEYAQQWVTRFGFDADRNPPYLTMALGAGTVTPMQMVAAYSVFANGGYLVEPVLVTRVTDAGGNVLTELQPHAPDPSERVIDARNAFVMQSLLGEVTRTGTARAAQKTLDRPDVYGKTGTTNDSMDAWFAGYQPTLTAVVWIGYDTPRKLGDKETGGGLALPVWLDYMKPELAGVPVTDTPAPAGLVNQGGEWFFEEYANGRGVASLGMEGYVAPPADAPTADERQGILDLFNKPN